MDISERYIKNILQKEGFDTYFYREINHGSQGYVYWVIDPNNEEAKKLLASFYLPTTPKQEKETIKTLLKNHVYHLALKVYIPRSMEIYNIQRNNLDDLCEFDKKNDGIMSKNNFIIPKRIYSGTYKNEKIPYLAYSMEYCNICFPDEAVGNEYDEYIDLLKKPSQLSEDVINRSKPYVQITKLLDEKNAVTYTRIPFENLLLAALSLCQSVKGFLELDRCFVDFSPNNIGICLEDGTIRIWDCDNVIIPEDKKAKKVVTGTAGFRAPEIVENKTNALHNSKSDLFSISLIMFRLLYFYNPFISVEKDINGNSVFIPSKSDEEIQNIVHGFYGNKFNNKEKKKIDDCRKLMRIWKDDGYCSAKLNEYFEKTFTIGLSCPNERVSMDAFVRELRKMIGLCYIEYFNRENSQSKYYEYVFNPKSLNPNNKKPPAKIKLSSGFELAIGDKKQIYEYQINLQRLSSVSKVAHFSFINNQWSITCDNSEYSVFVSKNEKDFERIENDHYPLDNKTQLKIIHNETKRSTDGVFYVCA